MQYNSLSNLRCTNHANTIAFADNLVIMIKAESITEAENIYKVGMSKISEWAKENKIIFNKQKSKVMLMTKGKRKGRKELEIYLNDKPLLEFAI